MTTVIEQTPAAPAETVVSGKAVSTGWTPEQEAVIARYQEKLGMNRGNAVRKLRTLEQQGKTAAQILEAMDADQAARSVETPEVAGAVKAPKKARKAKVAKAPKVKHEKGAGRKPKFGADFDDKAVAMYKAGKTVKEIMAKFGSSYAFTRWRLQDNKVFKPGRDRKAAA